MHKSDDRQCVDVGVSQCVWLYLYMCVSLCMCV